MTATIFSRLALLAAGIAFTGLTLTAQQPGARKKQDEPRFPGKLEMKVRPLAEDREVQYDFDIVYVRAPRKSPDGRSKWAEVGHPRTMEPGAPLMLLHPDGREEVLVPVNEKESIADPQVSFDGEWVYFAKMHDALGHRGADIYKVHVPTKKVVRLTEQKFTPNTGVADWSKTPLPPWGVYNLGPCPLPGGKVAFVSDRNTYKAQNPGYAPNALALQLFVMDDDGSNIECIGHLNLGMALHPVVLRDGRIMFSSLESQGLRSHHLWGIWSIHPDGTNWGPLFSAFEIGNGTADSTHFQTQLSDGNIVVESYYNLNNFGFGTYLKFPPQAPEGYAGFGPGYKADSRNNRLRHGRQADGRGKYIQFPFSPYGMEALTPFVLKGDWPSEPSVPGDKDSPRLGKFTHPAAAPDNHLLTAYSAGSLNSFTKYKPAFDSGIYLIKSGKPVNEPGEMRLIKNDPNYHEQWPRAVVPYRRIYGIDEPKTIAPLANDGSRSKHLPAGTPFGLVGTSSLYKRESYPYGVVKPGSVTAEFAGEKDPTGYKGFDRSFNWTVQGSDAGLYSNDAIHAIRIVHLEPTTEMRGSRTYYNHGRERMRILGEIPVRKFRNPSPDPAKNPSPGPSPKRGGEEEGGGFSPPPLQGEGAGGRGFDGGRGSSEPLDPDGNPDTSFLAKIPADIAWTFQTLDRRGMVLNSAQTWHQVRPGEIRNDCGGCHAHSQKPTDFNRTAAAKPDYKIFDLTERTPLLTTKEQDESKRKWDARDETGLKFAAGVQTVEYHRDIKPILDRSCVACHIEKDGKEPAGNLVLDDDTPVKTRNPAGLAFDLTVPGTYARLAADREGKWGHPPLHRHKWGHLPNSASRYVRMMQSRRSLLIWKIYGERLDGWANDDFPYETIPGDANSLRHKGQPVPDTPKNREIAHTGFVGSVMPPPEAVKSGKVAPLSDEDRLTLVRWIDLGCPIDLAFDAKKPDDRSRGWLLDDQRPTLALTSPKAGENESLDRILIGLHDRGTGLDLESLRVVADVPLGGVAAGENLAGKFREISPGVREWKPAQPERKIANATLTVSIRDRQGNETRIDRRFRVGKR